MECVLKELSYKEAPVHVKVKTKFFKTEHVFVKSLDKLFLMEFVLVLLEKLL